MSCTDKCHSPKFCVDCHSSKKVVPSSHRKPFWVKPATPSVSVYGKSAAQVKAEHALAAQDSIESCEVCHGAGGTNAAFCKSCHKLEVPHTEEFKKFHGATGRKNPAVCRNCHGYKEMCSNCHHLDSSNRVPWINRHGASVAKNGSAGCVEKCHKKTACVACHQKRKVVPGSHRLPGFVKKVGAPLGVHAAQFQKDGSVCTFCHLGEQDALPNSKFCKSCHKLAMPHPIDEANDQKFVHKDGFQKKQLNKATCARCHEAKFCNDCHHPAGAKSARPWVRYHPVVVKKDGAAACLDACHQETFCSECHVNRAAAIVKGK
jgi:hypothetical protein